MRIALLRRRERGFTPKDTFRIGIAVDIAFEIAKEEIVAVASDDAHRFSKVLREEIVLVEGWGVEGDAHAGTTVKHRSRVARDPDEPNLRQVHLLHAELFDEVADDGYVVVPGAMGENVTTLGVDLLALPAGALLELGEDAVVEITGLRTPCFQINRFREGLLKAVLGRDRA